MMCEDDDGPQIIVCAGPPLCLLEGEAVEAQLSGCELCKRITVHADGSETVESRTIN